MPMLKDPSTKYHPFPLVDLPNRQWPSKRLSVSPRWLSTDLRDGNQSLVNPMNNDQKRRYFQILVELGYKEIEISFPSSGKTDYDFTRGLVTAPGAIPSDVWIQVMTPCRKDLIDQTLDSVRGARNVILHLYIATSSCFQQLILGKTHEECKALAIECTKYLRSRTKDSKDSGVDNWMLQFSPEAFSDSNLDQVVDICDAVCAIWQPTPQDKMILNLPATVELSTPNVFADQVEYFSTHVSNRDSVVISLHPHNDRGCAVAAAELAQLAGAERVEGTLFGNGERTGNVDLVILALNLYTQGISPGVDFSDIIRTKELVESVNQIPVPHRWPYAGSMVTTAFSGSHQDAIKKGFDLRAKQDAKYEDRWLVPYLPWDPCDFGRTYEALIRVNSQSGKGGVSWIIQQTLGLNLPRGLLIEFSRSVQRQADMHGREVTPSEIQALFKTAYHIGASCASSLKIEYKAQLKDEDGVFDCHFLFDGSWHMFTGTRKHPLEPFKEVLKMQGVTIDFVECNAETLDASAHRPLACMPITFNHMATVTCVQCAVKSSSQNVWAIGVDEDPARSAVLALYRVILSLKA